MKLWLLLAAATTVLTGCTPHQLAAAVFSVASERDQAAKPADGHPSRQIRDQDCGEAIVYTGGNLSCK